ncbi:hypothetical protein C0991_001821 [Blastosporella zonata]|nr:hypothetical protein C0991_001821 [Blastosporella zonata]
MFDLVAGKVPVIISSGPSLDATATHGSVVFGDATRQKNSQKHGIPRKLSAATRIKGKNLAGKPSNPINLTSSDSPPPSQHAPPPGSFAPPKHHGPWKKSKGKSKAATTDDDYNSETSSNSEPEASLPRWMTHSKGPPKLTTPVTNPLEYTRAKLQPGNQNHTPSPLTPLSARDYPDNKEWQGIIDSLPKKTSNSPEKTVGQIIAKQKGVALQTIQKFTKVNTSSTSDSIGTPESTPPTKRRLYKRGLLPFVLITATPQDTGRAYLPQTQTKPSLLPRNVIMGGGTVNADSATPSGSGGLPLSSLSPQVSPTSHSSSPLTPDPSATTANPSAPLTSNTPVLPPPSTLVTPDKVASNVAPLQDRTPTPDKAASVTSSPSKRNACSMQDTTPPPPLKRPRGQEPQNQEPNSTSHINVGGLGAD